jgi:hypothetical protein
MILIGGLVGGPGVTSFGWVVLLAVLGVKLLVELLRSWLQHHRWWVALILLFVALGAFAIYRVVSWHGWLNVTGLLVIGSIIGLALSAGYGWLARPTPRRVVAPMLSIVLVAILGLAGAAHLRDDLSERACKLSVGWYRTVTTRLLVTTCPPQTD